MYCLCFTRPWLQSHTGALLVEPEDQSNELSRFYADLFCPEGAEEDHDLPDWLHAEWTPAALASIAHLSGDLVKHAALLCTRGSAGSVPNKHGFLHSFVHSLTCPFGFRKQGNTLSIFTGENMGNLNDNISTLRQ